MLSPLLSNVDIRRPLRQWVIPAGPRAGMSKLLDECDGCSVRLPSIGTQLARRGRDCISDCIE